MRTQRLSTPLESQMNLTDRDVITGLIDLVGALAERLTGKVPEVRLTDPNGNQVWIRPDLCRSRRVSPPQSAKDVRCWPAATRQRALWDSSPHRQQALI